MSASHNTGYFILVMDFPIYQILKSDWPAVTACQKLTNQSDARIWPTIGHYNGSGSIPSFPRLETLNALRSLRSVGII